MWLRLEQAVWPEADLFSEPLDDGDVAPANLPPVVVAPPIPRPAAEPPVGRPRGAFQRAW
jgi:hypothetical protein